MADPRPPGLVLALVGGVLGAGVGVGVSILVYEQVKAGDLSDIGTGVLLFYAGLLFGTSMGATIALALRKHDRALATGLLAGPLVTMAYIGGSVLLGRLPSFDNVAGIIGQPVLAAFSIAAIWIARWVTVR